MNTYRELVYLVLDEIKAASDDAYFTEDHVIYLLSKFRGLLLKQQYSDIKKEIPDSNFQTLCLELIEVPAMTGVPCEGGSYLRSKDKIPTLMSISTPSIYTNDYYTSRISFVSKERMKYVGYNKWLPNIIYASLGPDNYLYLKSCNPQFLYLNSVIINGIFENPEEASRLLCRDNDSNNCDILDKDFPLEESLIPQLVQLVVKDLLGASYRPMDNINNAKDDLSDLANFLRRNLKSPTQKLIEGDDE